MQIKIFELSNPFLMNLLEITFQKNNMPKLVARDSFICYSTCDADRF